MLRAPLIALTLLSAVALPACVTKPVDVTVLDIRPVLGSSEAELIDREALHASAKAAYKSEEFSAALTDYRKLVWDDAADIDAQIGTINAALALGHTDEAAKHLNLVDSELADVTQKARLLAADVLLDLSLKKDTDTEVRLNAALELNLQDHRLWNALGAWHDGREDWLKALDTYVIALDKSFTATGRAQSSIINNMGMSLLMQGRLDEALDKFEQALDLRQGARLYDNNRRLVYLLKGDTPAAIQDVSETRAAKLFADAGALAQARGELNRAQSYFKKALTLSPVYLADAAKALDKIQSPNTPETKAP